MREKTPRVVITFHTTAEAMATEKLCQSKALDGRLITADCGIAWSAPLALRQALQIALGESGIEYEGIYELLL